MAVNRTVKIAGAVVALVAVYFGLVVLSGTLSERAAQQLEAQGSIELANSRMLQVKKIAYERGFFQSVATGTYVLVGMTPVTSERKTVTFQMRHVITHGPITRSGLGWARTQSEIIFDPATATEVAKFLGDKKPLEIIVRHGFLGGIKGSLTSPAFEVEEKGTKFKWGGVQGRFALGRNGSALAGDFLLPSLSVAESEGNLTLKNMSVKFDLHRVFEVLYEGTMGAELSELLYEKSNGEPFKVEKLGYSLNLDRKGDFMDAKLRLGSGAVQVQNFKLKKAQYDLTVKHVHAPTYATYAKEIKAMTDKVSMGAADGAAADLMPNLVASMGDVFLKLLEKDPELVIDRIGVTAEQGEFGITGSMKLVGFKPEDLQAGPMGAMRKLQANFKVFLDEPLLDIELPKSKADEAADETADVDPSTADADQDPVDEDEDSDADASSGAASVDRSKLHAQLAEMEKAGFVERKGKRVESHVEIKNGQFTANGKPLAGGAM